MHLLRAEVSRLQYRPRVVVGLVSVLLLGLIGPALWMSNARPYTDQEVTEAVQAFEEDLPRCPECTLEQYLPDVWGLNEVVHIGVAPWLLLVAVFVLILVLVYAGADFQSGAITTQLTFTPARLKLLSARTLVAGLLGAVLMAVAGIASGTVSVVWFVALRGYADLAPGSGLLGALIGAVVLGMVVGMVAALAVFLFHSGAVAGAVVAVVLLASLLVEVLGWDGAPHWVFHATPTRHAESLVVGLAERGYEQYPLVRGETLSRTESLTYFLVLIAISAALAAVTFRRRDVKN
ncbi:hypothetical protein ACFQ06_05980 [Tessaracoccus lubricantis]|uniref:hypothetical protein n=1 Tax=Tessaracoccus lubricantis TaxID=545543 RepID=UPI00363B1E37